MDTWTRLEPHARERNLQYGLNAEVHDPLWFLTRQWQLLEFWGEDAGSPIFAEVKLTCTPITRYFPNREGKTPSTLNVQGQSLDGTIPLETLIERETVRQKEGQVPPLRLAAEAGLQFLRLLSANGAGALRAKVISDFPLKDITGAQKEFCDSDTVRFMAVMADRVPDGTLLRAGVQSWPGVPPALRESVNNTIKSWVPWYDTLFYEPSKPNDTSWIPPRLEYQALISASTPQGEVVLNVSEYADGHLDWYSFDAVSGGTLGAEPTDPTTVGKEPITRSVIPTSVTFPGMPASRYWEFEDANIDFGGIIAGEQQLAHLLLIEFGLVSGDDWFVIPVVLPVGTLCSTDKLVVSDTFGGAPTVIKSARTVEEGDPNRHPGPLPWDLFHLSSNKTPGIATPRPGPDSLFLPPTLGKSLQGKAIEEVLFMRDEMANMVWAVERTIESPLSLPVSQSEAYVRARKQSVPSVGPAAALTRRYRLASEVPPHWIPMLPVPMKTDRADQLGLKAGSQAKGRVMTELGGTPLYGEEVPREGVRVMRAYQYARWTGGETYLWVGRRNEVGRGEGSSGLVFDQLVPPDKN